MSMFRHKNKNQPDVSGAPQDAPAKDADNDITALADAGENIPKEESLEDLIKKNLKWSQIIYEQNRKINSKLLWSAIASWLYFIILIVPIILGLLFLPPLLSGVFSQYGELLNEGNSVSTSSPSAVDSLLKILNLDSAKQEQVKAILK